MKKIGIITLYYKSCNYGGLLQAYALEKYLINHEFDTKQICYDTKASSEHNRHQYWREIIKVDGLFKFIIKVLNKIKSVVYMKISILPMKYFHADKAIMLRKNSMTDFRENMIFHTEKVYDAKSIYDCNEFDVYICGSDQVWHGITSYSGLNTAFWLKFVKNSAIKISYAASISLREIPEQAESKICDALTSFHAISIREKSDKKKIEKIIGENKKIEWVLDPTLLLSRDEWEQIEVENKYSQQKYIFVYLLGDKKEDRKCIERFAKSQNLKIITIPYLQNSYRSCDRKFGDIQLSDVSPNLWISLIKNAQYVFTDSFHGSVFSIIFHKSFFTFKRFDDKVKISMNSRIYSLFELFDLEDRLIANQISSEEILKKKQIDYEKVDFILSRERQRSSDFLLNAIEGKA